MGKKLKNGFVLNQGHLYWNRKRNIRPLRTSLSLRVFYFHSLTLVFGNCFSADSYIPDTAFKLYYSIK